MSDKKSNRIPADQLTAYERWELPAMEPSGNDVIRSQVSSAEIPVKPLTASDLERIRLEAYEAGFAEGKEKGHAEGHKEGIEKGFQEGLESGTQKGLQQGQQTGQQQKQAEIDESIARLESVMAKLLDPIKQHDDEIEEALLNLVLSISRAVIIRELSIDSQQVRKTLMEALGSLPPSASNVKIWVNSVDYDPVFSIAESMSGETQIIKSDEILPGGCKVETLHSQIDATVEKRFQKTVQQMLDRHASSLAIDEAPDLTDSMDDMTDFHRDVLEDTEHDETTNTTPVGSEPEPKAPEEDELAGPQVDEHQVDEHQVDEQQIDEAEQSPALDSEQAGLGSSPDSVSPPEASSSSESITPPKPNTDTQFAEDSNEPS